MVDFSDPSRHPRTNCEAFAWDIRKRRLNHLGGRYLFDSDEVNVLTAS